MTQLPVDHAGMSVLPYEECLHLLATTPIGRVAFAADGDIVVLPVNYALDGAMIVFRTDAGSKLTAAEQAKTVAFEVDSWDAATHDGWSVIINGKADEVVDAPTIERFEGLGLRPWAQADRRCWVRIRPDSITGRRVGIG